MRKLLSTAVAFGVMASTSLTPLAYADVASNALPVLNSATNANVTTNNSNMNVQITGGKSSVGTLNWSNYNIGKDAGVNYEFTAHQQTALNKVDATGGVSQIFGKITNSSYSDTIDYAATGKVILINPNGVLFGNGSNVNVNSLTVSTLDGTYDPTTNQLSLTKNTESTKDQYGIIVEDGANIYGDKGVTLASQSNVSLYNGSKIATSIVNNGTSIVDGNEVDATYGKVKIITTDGVNFTYYNNGAVKAIANEQGPDDQMFISIKGDIEAGNIDIRNDSYNENSQINLNGATLKATKAEVGEDGNIWLTAANKIYIQDSSLETVNASDAAKDVAGGNIQILAGEKLSISSSDSDNIASNLNAVGNVSLKSLNNTAVVDSTKISSAKDVTVAAAKIASVQNKSTIDAKNITISGVTRGQLNNSIATATDNISISGDDMAWTNNSQVTAGKDVNVTSSNGTLLLQDTIVKAKNDINLTAKGDVSSQRLTGSTFTATDNNVNVKSTEGSILLTDLAPFVAGNKVTLNGAKNVEVNKTSDLETSNLDITAGENVFLTSKEGSVNLKDTTNFLAAQNIYVKAAKDVTTNKTTTEEADGTTTVSQETINFNNIQTDIYAGNDVDVKVIGVANANAGLIAEAGHDMTITAPIDSTKPLEKRLSVTSLKSGNDMTLVSNNVRTSNTYTSETFPTDDVDNPATRGYIEVGGTFTSTDEDGNVNYTVDASGDLSSDGYNQKHVIAYGSNGGQKFLLKNRIKADNTVTDPDNGDITPDTGDNGSNIDTPNTDNINDPTVSNPSENPGNTGNAGGNDGNVSGGNDGNGNDNNVEVTDPADPDIFQIESAPDLEPVIPARTGSDSSSTDTTTGSQTTVDNSQAGGDASQQTGSDASQQVGDSDNSQIDNTVADASVNTNPTDGQTTDDTTNENQDDTQTQDGDND